LIIPFILQTIHHLLKYYLSSSEHELNGFRSRLFDVLIDLVRSTKDEHFKSLIVFNLIKIAPPNKNLLMIEWFMRGDIFYGDITDSIFVLMKQNRYEILKQAYRARDLSNETK
jgi:hypothetical protein